MFHIILTLDACCRQGSYDGAWSLGYIYQRLGWTDHQIYDLSPEFHSILVCDWIPSYSYPTHIQMSSQSSWIAVMVTLTPIGDDVPSSYRAAGVLVCSWRSGYKTLTSAQNLGTFPWRCLWYWGSRSWGCRDMLVSDLQRTSPPSGMRAVGSHYSMSLRFSSRARRVGWTSHGSSGYS